MGKQPTIGKGMQLEARIQRLFMCQGAFAERGLVVRATKHSSKMVTDIDVVAHDYSINFHHTRIYAECKGGRRVSTLDRVVWVRGMMDMIGAEVGYFVLDHCDPDSVTFAKTLNVEVLQGKGLRALEGTLGIGETFYPGRSNIAAYAVIERTIDSLLKRKVRDEFSAWLMEASSSWRDASALAFSYGRLNQLLRILKQSNVFAGKNGVKGDEGIAFKYAIAALIVRLSQYVLFATADTLGMTKTEREKYIAERFIAGDRDIGDTRVMLENSLRLAKVKLEEVGVEGPANWTTDHLLTPPTYSKAFAEVVERVIADGHRARFLPLTLEIQLFGFGGKGEESAGLLKKAIYGLDLTGVIKGFITQSIQVPQDMMSGLASNIKGVNVLEVCAKNRMVKEKELKLFADEK